MTIELHTPQGAIRTAKEFANHIATVTIGILIALALDGLVQSLRNQRLLVQTRQEFRAELSDDQRRAHIELAGVLDANNKLKALVTDLPSLQESDPGLIVKRLLAVQNPGYFLPANSWQTALSTGVLAHMPPDEVERYANVFYLIRAYADAQRDGLAAEDQAKAFVQSHVMPNSADTEEGVERIVLFARSEDGRATLCARMDKEIGRLLPEENPAETKPKDKH